MAKNLNKSRIAMSRIMMAALLLIVFFTDSLIPLESGAHEFFDILGTILVSVCALGRLYTTAYLGGFKNDTLITYGPFSAVRNPLYFFSLIGFIGVAMMTNHIFVMLAIPIGFILLYTFLIRREERFLLGRFGEEYRAYMAATPRLIPSFRNYHFPDAIQMNPKYLDKGFKDAIWWFAAFPLVELAEFIQKQGLIHPPILLP
ncbi:MAG TPA: isoprenylcysteine carboxylmethyltransferase family protein [Micavibrio sp.]